MTHLSASYIAKILLGSHACVSMEAIFRDARTLVRTYCLIKIKETASKKNLWYSSKYRFIRQ